MEGVPFVGNDACAHNLLLKGRPLIMRLQQVRITQPGELDDGQCGATYASIADSRTSPWLLSEWGCPVAARVKKRVP